MHRPRRLRPACPATKGAGSSASLPLPTANHNGLRRQGGLANASTKSSVRRASPCLPGHKGRGKQREPFPDNRQPQRAEATGLHGERINHNVRKEGYALLARPRGAREAARANPCQPPTTTGWGDRTACDPSKTERSVIFIL